MSTIRFLTGMKNSTGYGSASTCSQVAADNKEHILHKNIFITGATSGIGMFAATSLAANGANLYMTARSMEKGNRVKGEILLQHPHAVVHVLECDLSSMESVQRCARAFNQLNVELHVLINNAGILDGNKRRMTPDGLENHFGTNHIGPFLLTLLLLDSVKRAGRPDVPSRVVMLSSSGHADFVPKTGVPFDDLQADRSYNSMQRYGISKLCNLLFAKELNRRMESEDAHVIVNALHPGAISTPILKDSMWLKLSFRWPFAKNKAQGAATTVFAAAAPGLQGGQYFVDCAPARCSRKADDRDLAQRLWAVSEDIVRPFL